MTSSRTGGQLSSDYELVCRNNGTFVARQASVPAHCVCTENYTGYTCDLDKAWCSRVVCNNRGLCSFSPSAKEIGCICEDFFQGGFHTTDIKLISFHNLIFVLGEKTDHPSHN